MARDLTTRLGLGLVYLYPIYRLRYSNPNRVVRSLATWPLFCFFFVFFLLRFCYTYFMSIVLCVFFWKEIRRNVQKKNGVFENLFFCFDSESTMENKNHTTNVPQSGHIGH